MGWRGRFTLLTPSEIFSTNFCYSEKQSSAEKPKNPTSAGKLSPMHYPQLCKTIEAFTFMERDGLRFFFISSAL